MTGRNVLVPIVIVVVASLPGVVDTKAIVVGARASLVALQRACVVACRARVERIITELRLPLADEEKWRRGRRH